MRFSTATIIAFIGMSNALPARLSSASTSPCESGSTPIATPALGVQGSPSIQSSAPVSGLEGYAPKVPDSATTRGPDSTYPQPTGAKFSVAPQPSGGSSYGSGGSNLGGGSASGFDLGGLLGGLMSGGTGGAGGALNIDGVIGDLGGLLKGSGYMDGSGHVDIAGLLDGLKGKLKDLPGGAELSAVCDQLKAALSGSGNIDINGLISGLKGMISGSGKFDLGSALGVDVGSLTHGLSLLLNASGSGSGALDIGAMLDKLESYLGASGHIDMGSAVGLDLSSVFSQLKTLLGGSVSGSANLDISGLLNALKGLLSGSLDLNGFVSACSKLPGGQLLVSLYGKVTGLLGKFGIDLNGISSKITGALDSVVQGTLGGSLLGNGSVNLKSLLNVFG
jgi:hypothetical protein